MNPILYLVTQGWHESHYSCTRVHSSKQFEFVCSRGVENLLHKEENIKMYVNYALKCMFVP